MAKNKSKKTSVVNVDLSNVESGGLVPEGEILATVKGAEVLTSDSSGKTYIKWSLSTAKGPLFFNTSLQPQALFNLRGLLEAMNVEIPSGPMELDLDEMIGKQFIAIVEHEKYEGKLRARVSEYMTATEAEDDDDEPEVNVDKGKKSSKKDELPKISEDELEEKDEEDLEEIVKEYKLDIDLSTAKSLRKKCALVTSALEEAGYLDEE